MTSPDNMDDFFENIFGVRPSKRGKGFEMLVGAVLKILGVGADVKVDQYLKGTHSGSTYQLDNIIKDDPGTFVEAKDYAERGKPVGRGDLQKLSGALQDLPLGRGIIASATGFTKPSQHYAGASKKAVGMKPIELAHVRPSVEEDNHGRVKTIILRLTIHEADFDSAKWLPRFTADAIETLQSNEPDGVEFGLGAFLDGAGNVKQTVRDFTLEIQRNTGFVKLLKGEQTFDAPTYVRYGTGLLQIAALGYEIPYNESTEEIRIEATGTPRVMVKLEDGTINTLVTAEQLKLVRFGDDGEVILDGDPMDARVRRSDR